MDEKLDDIERYYNVSEDKRYRIFCECMNNSNKKSLQILNKILNQQWTDTINSYSKMGRRHEIKNPTNSTKIKCLYENVCVGDPIDSYKCNIPFKDIVSVY